MGSPATPYLQVVKGSRDQLFEFWNPFYMSGTVGWNLTCRFFTRGTNDRNAKLSNASGRGHVIYF